MVLKKQKKRTSAYRPERRTRFLDRALGNLDWLPQEDLQTVIQRLARERAFFEVLFHTIEDGVVVTLESGGILYANEAVEKLLGLPQGVDESHEIQRYLPDLDWKALLEASEGSLGVFQRHEFEIYYPQQRFIRLEVARLAGSQNENGEGRIALILHDATETRKKTFEAMESERVAALTLLAASVAHEIGNPLNALSIHLQLMSRELKKLESSLSLQEGSVEPPAGRTVFGKKRKAPATRSQDEESLREQRSLIGRLESYLKIARGEIGRLDYITTQFLQAMRPTPPRLALALLNDAVHDVVELMQPEVENRQMFVELDLRQDLMLAYFDMEQIKQVLLNLVKNAIQVMPSGGQLTLRTRQNVHWVWVSIGDTGPGMSQAQLKSLFTPFFTTREEGSGLGLMVVQRIIRAHRGRIEVESQEGQGTEFRVFLPLQEQGPQLLNPASSEPPESEEEEL